MQSLISALQSWLSGYNRGWRGAADRCVACVGGLIRAGLKSVVIAGLKSVVMRAKGLTAKGEAIMQSFVNFFSSLRIQALNLLMAGVLGFALVFGIVAHLDAQSLQFVEKGRYPVGRYLNGIGAGDLNGDRNLDLVIPSYDDDVKVLLGDGTGAFRSPTTYYGGYRETATPVLADFNNDGNLDAAISNNDGASFSSMLGDGTGALTEVWTGSTGSYPHQITGGDFNADGVPDIATISWLGYRLTVFIGQGDGTFSSQQYPMGTNLNGVAAGDFNGDGNTDLAVSVYYSEQIAQFWGNGDGTFTQGDRVSVSSGGRPHFITAGEFNNDGVDDIAVNVGALDQLSIFLGTAGGNLTWKQDLGYASGHNATTVADFNSDGALDLVVTSGGDLYVLTGNGDGTFSEEFRLEHTGADVMGAVAAGDFNGDGLPDIAVGIKPEGEDATVLILTVTDETLGDLFTLYSTSFESPSFVEGPINGQNDWAVQGDENDAVVESGVAATGAQSLRLNIPSGNVYAGQSGWDYSPLEAGGTSVVLQAKLRPGAGSGTRQVGFYTDTSTMIINMSGGSVYGGFWYPDLDTLTFVTLGSYVEDQWGTMSIALNYETQQCEFAWEDLGPFPLDLRGVGPVSRFMGWNFGGINGPSLMYVDDVSVLTDQVPRLTVSTPDTVAFPGSTIAVPIFVDDAAGIAGVEITLTYNPAILTATGVQKTALTSNFTLADTFSAGQAKISLASGTGISSGTGSLVDVTFRVSEDASPGDTTSIVLERVALYDEFTNPIGVTTTNGLLTVSRLGMLTRISVFPDSAIVEVGKTQQFTAEGFDGAGNPVEVSPTWSVVPSKIGDISTDGLFTAKAWGEGKVIATEDDIADTVTVIVGILGDVNFDGLVDVRDAIICLRIEAELPLPPFHETPTTYERWAADMNRDEVIEANDALLILYKSLGKPVAKPVPSLAGVEAAVRLADVSESQGLITVPIVVEHRSDVYAADVRLSYDPGLLRPMEVKAGASDALLVSNTQKEGRIIAAMISTEGLLASDGSLLSVTFEVKGDFEGQSPLQFERVRLFDPSAEPIGVRIDGKLASTEQTIPQTYGLSQNFPNPFNASTVIRIQLPQEDRVTLRVYTLSGQVVRTLVDSRIEAGEWSILWDGRDEKGREVSSGVYFYRLAVDGGRWIKTMKMILLK